LMSYSQDFDFILRNFTIQGAMNQNPTNITIKGKGELKMSIWIDRKPSVNEIRRTANASNTPTTIKRSHTFMICFIYWSNTALSYRSSSPPTYPTSR